MDHQRLLKARRGARSAAKERAERAYKKLDVHNRADAVARARELGLIKHAVSKPVDMTSSPQETGSCDE